MAAVDFPCVKLPKLPDVIDVSLPGGVKLSAFLDFSKGMPTDCTVAFSLLQQLAPVLASLAPLLNILGVIKALADFATNPLVKGPALIQAIEKLAGFFVALTPAGIAVTIADILKLIIGFLECFITQLEAVVKMQADLALVRDKLSQQEAAGDVNLVLQASLACAEANASVAMDQVMASLGPIKPLLDIVTTVAGIANLPLKLPGLSVSGGDSVQAVASLREAVDSLNQVIQSLPM
jgi:hypothetical protein